METKNIYDVIIMGIGPAGLSTALYTQRANLKTLIIGEKGGSLLNADIQNFFGISTKTRGSVLIDNTINNLNELGAEFVYENVVKINPLKDITEITTSEGKIFYSKFLVIAIGKSQNNIIQKSGISYCATCDGFFYRNKIVAVKGNSSFTLEEAEYLKNICQKVYILTDGEAPKFNTDIQIIDQKIKDIVYTDTTLDSVVFDGFTLKLDGLFITDSVTTSSMQGFGIITKNNHIKVDENYRTNIKNIYAVGDIIGMPYQIAKAVYDGMMCSYAIIKENNIQKNNTKTNK